MECVGGVQGNLLILQNNQMVLSPQVECLIKGGALKDVQNIDHIHYLLEHTGRDGREGGDFSLMP